MATKRNYFSELEKKLNRELVEHHKDILESKKNDYRAIKQKVDAWTIVKTKFNAQPGVKLRDEKQIKKCWENLKSRAKTALSKERRERLLTGGGPQPNIPDESTEAVASIVPTQITPLQNPFDDDAGPEDIDDSNCNPDTDFPTENETMALSKNSVIRKRSAVSCVSSTSVPKAVKRSVNAITSAQQEVLDKQDKEHQLQMKILNNKLKNDLAEHNIKMEIYKNNYNYWNYRYNLNKKI